MAMQTCKISLWALKRQDSDDYKGDVGQCTEFKNQVQQTSIHCMWEGSKFDVMNFSPSSEWMAKVNHPSDNKLMLETPAF